MTVEVAGRPRAVVFDIDGVVADVRHRMHHLEQPRKDWAAFFAAAAADRPWRGGSSAPCRQARTPSSCG